MDNYGFQSEPENSFHENYNLYRDKRSQSFATAGFVFGLIAALTPYFVFTSLILRTACHYFRSVVQRRGNDHGYQR